MAVKLSKRMQEIKNLISFKRVADIGSDHGKIVVQAFKESIIDFAIFSDISEKSAQKPRALLEKMGVTDFDIRVGDGLETLSASDNIEQVLICGMGGEEIINILSATHLSFKSYILQPQKHEEKLKYFLVNNGFKIVFDKIIYDNGKFYNILAVEKGKGSMSEKQALFGLNNKNNGDFTLYLQYLKKKYTHLLKRVTNEKKRDQLVAKLKLIEGEINE